MRIPRLVVLGVLAAIGCAVQFQPGDYGEGSRLHDELDAGEVDAHVDVDAPPDAGADTEAGPRQRLFVFAGRNEYQEPAGDVWVATIDRSGIAREWERLQPGVFRGPVAAATLAEEHVFLAMAAGERFVQYAPLESGRLGFWKTTTAPIPVATGGYASVFVGTNLLALGGAAGPPFEDRVWISRFDADAGAFEPLVESSTKLPYGMAQMQVVTYKDFVYVLGGLAASADQSNRVFVARVDAEAGIGPLTATESAIDPVTGSRYTFSSSSTICVAEGAPGKARLILPGGMYSDVVLTSAIDEETGLLGPWERGPTLPGPLDSPGCATYGGFFHLLGGSSTNLVLRARFDAEGKLGEWEVSLEERLPAPRSRITAFVY